MTTPDIEFENSSGNVFTDLGLETRKSFTRVPRSALKSSSPFNKAHRAVT